jgi:hypothetical protein
MKAYSFRTGLSGLSDLIHSEWDPTHSTDREILAAGVGGARKLEQFALVAGVIAGVATLTPAAPVGAGNGVLADLTADAGAPEGEYVIVFTEPAANGGAFNVLRPGGAFDGAGTVGVAYNGAINFNLGDGAVDWGVGTYIKVALSYAPGMKTKYVRWDPAATNGAQHLLGVNLFDAEAAEDEDGELVVLKRGPAVIRKEAVSFHAGATDAQKAVAFATLLALGIKPAETG